jgi:hypothetical protein
VHWNGAHPPIRVCWGFDFGASAAKFCHEQGAMREHSHSYATEEQRSTGQNLASAAQKVNPQQTLSKVTQYGTKSNGFSGVK